MSDDEDSVHLLEDSSPTPERPGGEYEGGFQHDSNLFEKQQRGHGGGRKKADDWQHVTVSQSQSSDGFGKLKFTVICKCGHKIGIYSQKPKVTMVVSKMVYSM